MKLINSKTILDSFIKVIKCTLQGKEKQKTKYLVKVRKVVAAVVKNTATNEFIFVKQYRVGSDDFTTEIVAGGIDANETPEYAIEREVAEETGFAVDKLVKLTEFYSSPGFTDEYMHLYYCQVSKAADNIKLGYEVDNEEDIELVKVKPVDLQEFLESNNDSKTIIGIHEYYNKI